MSKLERTITEMAVENATNRGKRFQRVYTGLGLISGVATGVSSSIHTHMLGEVAGIGGAAGAAVAMIGSYAGAKRADKKCRNAIMDFEVARYRETGSSQAPYLKQELTVSGEDFSEKTVFDWRANPNHATATPFETITAPLCGYLGTLMASAGMTGSVIQSEQHAVEGLGGMLILVSAGMQYMTEWSYENRERAYMHQIANIDGGMSIG